MEECILKLTRYVSDSVRVRVVPGEKRVMAERAEASAAASAHSWAYFLQIGHVGRRAVSPQDFLVVSLSGLAQLHDLRRTNATTTNH